MTDEVTMCTLLVGHLTIISMWCSEEACIILMLNYVNDASPSLIRHFVLGQCKMSYFSILWGRVFSKIKPHDYKYSLSDLNNFIYYSWCTNYS